MDANKAQTVVSALISQGFQVQALADAQGNWSISVQSEVPIATQVVEQFRNNQGIVASVRHVVFS